MCRKDKYKDLNKWRATRKRQHERYYGKTSNAINSKEKWNEWEESLIIAHEHTDTQLAEILGRSVRSIQNKRYKLKCALNKTAS